MSPVSPFAQDQLRIIPHPELNGSYLIEADQWIPLTPAEIFSFYGDPFNLERITPPWLQFRVVTPLPIEMQEGLKLDYRLKLHGLPVKWQSLISAWEPPHRFVDQQVIGPYRRWYHEHLFQELEGGTRVIDRVTYAVPGGRLINRFFVQPDLMKIFRYRREVLEEVFSAQK